MAYAGSITPNMDPSRFVSVICAKVSPLANQFICMHKVPFFSIVAFPRYSPEVKLNFHSNHPILLKHF